jgi:diguanylate cyclase (GGDEF)-like protein/PAS domain S-box-containing protein
VIDPREILDCVSDGVYFVDASRRITYWNEAASEITGHAREDVVGCRCPEGPLRHVDEEGRALCRDGCPLAATLLDGQPRTARVLLQHRDGHRLPVRVAVRAIRDEGGSIVGAVETFADDSALTDARRRAAELARLAFADSLTGLANRRLAEQELSRQLARLDRHGKRFGVLLLDLDHFKLVNDSHGHEVGDAALAMVGRTLGAAARATDFVARWGGEEFLAIVESEGLEELRVVAERFRRLVESCSLQHSDVAIRVTVSVGGALARPGEAAPALLRRADAELYRCKDSGRNRACIAA